MSIKIVLSKNKQSKMSIILEQKTIQKLSILPCDDVHVIDTIILVHYLFDTIKLENGELIYKYKNLYYQVCELFNIFYDLSITILCVTLTGLHDII